MNQLSKIAYNYIKSRNDKEQKILAYYKRINSIEQPKILAIPRRKKGTKKNTDNIKKTDENNENNELLNKKDEKIEIEKKLTKKRVVDMGD
jgi:hypothetical protein